MSRRVIGIDLGTLNSCVAAVREGRAEVLSCDSRGTVPSCVAFTGEKVLVGEAAKRHAVTEPQSTLIAVKRLIGHPFDSREVQDAAARLPYEIKKSRLGSVLLQVGDEELSPVQVSSMILGRIKQVAEQALGEPVSAAVISVPAHFNDVQRKATKLAAEDAGLEVLRLINEPTAAAFAYGYKKATDLTLAVYDLGGGTFDVTILRAQGDTFSVVATDGDSYLGGEDFDFVIADWLEAEFAAEFGQDLTDDSAARLRVKEAAEKAKIELTEVETTQVDLPFLTKIADGSRPNFSRPITRAKVEELVGPLVERTRELCERCLETAGVRVKKIDEVLMVGGQSRMPIVRESVRSLFQREPRRDINPDEVVALGAALYAYSLVADDLKDEAEADAAEAYAVAVKGTAVARKIVSEIANLGDGQLDDEALASRLEDLLKQAEGGAMGDDDTQGSLGTSPALDRQPEPPIKPADPPAPRSLGKVELKATPAPAPPLVEEPLDDFPAPKFDEPEPVAARTHDTLEDFLAVAEAKELADDTPTPPAAEPEAAVDDFPAPKFDEPEPVAADSEPQHEVDDFPAPKFDEPEPVAADSEPQHEVDDFPAPKFDEPEPVAADSEPQHEVDDFPAPRFDEPEPVAADSEPQHEVDDFPAPRFDEPEPVAADSEPQHEVDDFPAPRFDEPEPVAADSKPQHEVDDFPAPRFDEPEPVAADSEPQHEVDDFPAPRFDEPEHVAADSEPQREVDDFPAPRFDEPEHDPLDDFLAEAQARKLAEDTPEAPPEPAPALEDDFEFELANEPLAEAETPPETPAGATDASLDFSPETGFELGATEGDLASPEESEAGAPLEFGAVDFSEQAPRTLEDVALIGGGQVEPTPEPSLDYGQVDFEADAGEAPADPPTFSTQDDDLPAQTAPSAASIEFGDATDDRTHDTIEDEIDDPGAELPAQKVADPESDLDFELDPELPAQRESVDVLEAGRVPDLDLSAPDLDDIDLSEEEIAGYDSDMDLPSQDRGLDIDLPTTLDAAAVAQLNDQLKGLGDNAMEVIRRLEASGAGENLPELMEKAKALLANTVGGAQEASELAAERLHEVQEHSHARKIELLDVTSLPVGIASAGDIFSVLIEQNVTVPAEHQRVFTTNQDGQAEVEIRVFQGRGKRVPENQHLGSFILAGIPPARRMEPRIEVTFRIDENGILSVKAREQGSGVEQEIRVEDPVGLMADPNREPEVPQF